MPPGVAKKKEKQTLQSDGIWAQIPAPSLVFVLLNPF